MPTLAASSTYAIMAAMGSDPQSSPFLIRASLISAVCMPVFYYLTQLVAAPFYPGYSFFYQVASMLGTGNSRHPWIFNFGIILTGAVAIFGSYGLYKSFRSSNGIVLSRFIAFAVAYTGAASIKAGIFPLPDPRHGTPGITFTLAIPVLMFIAARSGSRPRALQVYLLLSALLLIPVMPLMPGSVTVSWIGRGIVQRFLALATYVPVGVVAAFFLRESSEHPFNPSTSHPD